MIIAIDGPAASGKGTIAKRLAKHYGLPHLDTGLIYRAVAKAVLEESLSEAGRELTANAVEVLVSRLRRALGEANSGIRIETVRGVGYQLKVEDEG